MAGRFAKRWESMYRAIREDIFKFCEAMNFKPTWQQRQFLELVQRGCKRIAVKSGQGPGKTTVSVIAALWRTLQWEDAMTIVTAPTMRQCTTVWLTEARRLLKKADPMISRFIEITNTKLTIAGREEWGVKTVTATNPEAAQGLHEKNMTVICEEASGIGRDLITQFEGTSTNPNSMMIQVGNPNSRDCAFFDCFTTMRDFWECLTFNAEDTARDYPWLLSPENVEYMAMKYGRDSDVYRVRVLGEFPSTDPRCVINIEACEAAALVDLYEAARVKRYMNKVWLPARQFGLDFARFGGDESVIARRTGNAIVEFETFNRTEPGDVVDRAFYMQARAGWRDERTWYVPDASGMGQGVMRQFHRAKKRVMEFHNHGKSSDPMFDNKITEAWFTLAYRLLDDEIPVHLPKDNRLFQQLSTRQYTTAKNGKLIIEPKDHYMDRGYDSPDRADAIVMSFYEALTAGGKVVGKGDVASRRKVLKQQYDKWEKRTA